VIPLSFPDEDFETDIAIPSFGMPRNPTAGTRYRELLEWERSQLGVAEMG
jgi:hypothetical protein